MPRRFNKRVLLAGALVVASLPVWAGTPNMQPGMWETTVKMEMEGMPIAMPPFTSRHCITKEDLVPKTQRPGQQCEVSHQKISGNTVSWQVTCQNSGRTTTGDGTITYDGDSYHGTINMHMTGGGGPAMTMHQNITGKRIGDCK
jgi:hypothetical protein